MTCRFLTSVVLICSIVVICPVATATEDKNALAAEKPKKKNQRICKKVKPTGSHIAQRVCLKGKEWDAMEQAAREKLRNSTVGETGGVSQ